VTHVFDFFHCPSFVKHALSDIDLLESIGWTRFGYISFLFYLTMEAEPSIEVLFVCLTKTRQWEKVTLLVSMFHCAFFNSIIDKHQHMHFFTFKTVLV